MRLALTRPSPARTPPARTPLTGGGRGRALAAASLSFAIVQLDVSVVNVAARAIGTDLGGTISDLQWVVDAYTVAFAALILTAGTLGDRFGPPRMLLFGFAAFTLSSAACGAAPSIEALIGFRAVQGLAAAVLGSCSLALLSRTFPDGAPRARALGIWAVSGSAAMAAGPLAGGLLITAAGWRAIFFINLPVGIAGFWLTARFAGQAPRGGAGGGLDLPGQVSAATALAALAAATIEAGTRGVSLPVIVGYAVAAVAAAVFVVSERRAARPMIPLPFFRSRPFSAAVGTGCVLNVVVYGLIFVFSLFFQRAEGLSPLAAGAAFLPLTGAVMASNIVAARVMKARGARPVIGYGGLILGAACAALWLTLTVSAAGAHGSAAAHSVAAHSMAAPSPALIGALVAGLAVAGFGCGLVVPAMTSAVLAEAPPSRAGIASGTLTAARQSGSVLGVAIFGALFASGLASDLRTVLVAAVLLSLTVALLSRLIRPT